MPEPGVCKVTRLVPGAGYRLELLEVSGSTVPSGILSPISVTAWARKPAPG